VSDYDAWANIYSSHHYAKSMEGAAAIGLNAGMDQEGGGDVAIKQLQKAIDDKKTSAAAVATALRRLLRIRIRLGMFDPPLSVAYNNLTVDEVVLSRAHLAIARETALESMTLLKNANTRSTDRTASTPSAPALPLDPSTFKDGSVLGIFGPQAKMAGLLMGNYAESGRHGNWGTSIFDAITQRLGNSSTVWETGCNDINCDQSDDIAAAVALASQASVKSVVVTLGLGFNGIAGPKSNPSADESEGHDRVSIELPGHQSDLVTAIRAANPTKPIIGLLIHGGTLALGKAGDDMDAIMSAWYPGEARTHTLSLFGCI
jgi:beta-glucosidase